MATKKSIQFAAPYNSKTFKRAQEILVGANGVISGGKVSSQNGVVTVQPLMFAQAGLFVTTDYVMTVVIPGSLSAPYSLAVSTPSSIESPNEVLVPTFVKRPQDVSAETVIIADWDGTEWLHRPHLQIAELVHEHQKGQIDRDLIGIYKGFDVSATSESVLIGESLHQRHRLNVGSGTLVNRAGALVVKQASAEFVTAPEDRSFDRTDTLVFRQPKSPLLGPGQLKILLGDTYHADGSVVAEEFSTLQVEDQQAQILKSLSLPDLSVAWIYLSDYGARAQLRCRITQDGDTAADFFVAQGVESCDAIFNQADNRLEFVYSKDTRLFYKSTTLNGTAVFDETLITLEAAQVSAPKIVSTPAGVLSLFHIFYELHVSASDKRLKYSRLSSLNTKELETPATLISLGVPLTNFVVSSSGSDMLAYVAYKNASTGRAYLRSYDLGVFVVGGAPKEASLPIELQDDALLPSLSTTVESQNVDQIQIIDDGSDDPYVLWKHVSASGAAYVGVHHKSFHGRYDHKALIFDPVAVFNCEEMSSFSVVKTPVGDLLLTLVCQILGQTRHLNVKIDLATLEMGELLSSTEVLEASRTVSLLDPTGGLSVAFSGQPSAAVANGTSTSVVFFGPGTFGDQLITEREFVLACSTGNILSPGYNELPKAPASTDLIELTGASLPSNTGTVTWVADRTLVVEGVQYKAVQTSEIFQTEQPESARAQFSYFTGTPARTYRINTGKPTNLRGFRVSDTDVFVANIRISDGQVAASGVAIEENLPIARLYEYFNCFAGGGGTVSWEEAGLSNKLKFTQALAINFYNRKSTYTIPATDSDGVTLLQNQVLYVQIPDEDTSTTLEVKVANFGEGVLDRYGKNVYPLFWNTQGTLYTRFAPFRLASGEVIQIGDQVSRQLLDWLGATSSTPDKLQHGYLSTLRISQDDSVIEAISNLDAGIESVREELTDLNLDVAEDLYAYMSQCRLVAEDTTQLRILSSDRVLPTGETLTRPLSSMKLSFEGAFIDFAQGKVFASDGLTSLGLDFTPVVLSSGHYQWFSISLVPYLIDATTNEMGAQVLVIPAASSSLSAASAPRASYPSTGMSLGMVRLQGGASGLLPIQQSSLEIIAVGGGTGTGSGGGSGDIGTPISPADGFKAVVYDYFTESSDSAESSISGAATTASYITAAQHYRILCDGTKTAVTIGAAFTLDSAPSFQLKAGDILFSPAQNVFRRIASLTSQTQGILDAAFDLDISGTSVFLSQVVVTKDLVGLGDAEEKSRLEDTFPGKLIDRISLSYTDSLAEGDTVSDFNSAARVVISASAQGRSTLPSSELFSSPYTRPTGPQAIQDYPLTASGEGLFLICFANPFNSSVVSGANLLSYEASVYTEELLHSGWSLDSGYKSELGDELGLTATSTFLESSPSLTVSISAGSNVVSIVTGDVVAVQSWAGALNGFEVYGSGIAPGSSVLATTASTLNLSSLALNTGFTQLSFRKAATEVTLSFDYVPGLREGSLEGDLEVIVGGKPIPRYSGYYVGRHYKEVAGTTDTILLSFELAPEEELVVRRRQGTIDTSSTNGAKLALLHTAIVGTQAQVEAGVASYSTIQAAHDSVTGSGKIVILPGTYEESVTWTRDDLVLEGRGRLTVIDGDFLLSGHGNDISGIKVLGDLTLTGSDYNFVKMWLGSQSVFTPGGQFNLLSVIQE